MKPHTLKRLLPVVALLVIVAVLIALPRLDGWFFAGSRYAECGRMLKSDPGQALNFAQAWRASRPASPLARHCEALALYATQDYGHAAEAFTALAQEAAPENPGLATELFLQSARAHKAGGHADLARQAAASALVLQPRNADAKALIAQIGSEVAQKPQVTLVTPNLQKK